MLWEAIIGGVVSGAVAGAMAGATVSVRVVNKARSKASTRGDHSPAASAGNGQAIATGDHATIINSFNPPQDPSPKAVSDEQRIDEIRVAVAAADHAWKLMNRPELAIEAVRGLVDSTKVHHDALEAQQLLHAALLGAPNDRVHELLDTMERRLQGAANGFAYAINYLVQHPDMANSPDGRAAMTSVLAEGLTKLEDGKLKTGSWTDDLRWSQLSDELAKELRSL